MEKNRIVKPKSKFFGNISLPGDKSIAHRLILLSILLKGRFEISNLPMGQDVQTSIDIVKKLGVKVTKKSNNNICFCNSYKRKNETDSALIETCNTIPAQGFSLETITLDCQNSGTTARLLAGILANKKGNYILTGDNSLRSRPMKRIIEPLKLMGINISSDSSKNTLPINVSTIDTIKPIDYLLPVASAQVKSSILFSALAAYGKTNILEPLQSRDHTEKLLQYLGANIKVIDKSIEIEGPFTIMGNYSFHIPNDPSSAAYFIVGALITGNSRITLNNILYNPTRTAYIEVLKQMGANIKIETSISRYCEQAVNIEVKTSQLQSVEIDANKVPLLIDELPILAVAMCFAKGKSRVTGASELRFKETDRISNLIIELKKFGVNCCELEDGFEIIGPTKLTQPISIDSHNDHRIAMSMAIISGKLKQETTILNGDCVKISLPNFYDLLA